MRNIYGSKLCKPDPPISGMESSTGSNACGKMTVNDFSPLVYSTRKRCGYLVLGKLLLSMLGRSPRRTVEGDAAAADAAAAATDATAASLTALG